MFKSLKKTLNKKRQLTSLSFALVAILTQPAFASASSSNSTATIAAAPQAMQRNVIEQNQSSLPVFGQNLFSGGFAKASFKGFNPNYQIAVGDQLLLQMWGAYEAASELTVDPQGNIFLPQVGPVHLAGVTNAELNKVVNLAVKRVYQSNVQAYVTLAATQPVKLFVTGFVKKPGLYGGLSSDSILSYLEKAGGIQPQSGSYLDIQLLRNNRKLASFNLYQFIRQGKIKQLQLHDGDMLMVASRQASVSISGLVQNPAQFEFIGKNLTLAQALKLSGKLPLGSHVRINRSATEKIEIEYIALATSNLKNIQLNSGDEVEIVADRAPGNILVKIEGEHAGQAEYVLPYGAKLVDALRKLPLTQQSSLKDLRIYRKSVAARQKEMLLTSLQRLEAVTLSARSSTSGEAQLRAQDAKSILQFIDRAKLVEPLGQVILSGNPSKSDLTLQQGDRLVIPDNSNLVQVHGEVMFPNALEYQTNKPIQKYVADAGGYSQKADQSKLLILHRNGRITQIKESSWYQSEQKIVMKPGDEILVMPQVDVKNLQLAKDITEIVYRIAISTAAVVGL
ncbi:polysaccharide biosynthesis/export family protein [Pelagibaculum spongiae]|uniref:Polysialic acid transporter n=1 Tax=Pelagibaculum spongiae TaxID=2080658 RepID=A0A2V1GW54_9GAMM|nr:polysaccharide biosynthesis/export family protein [Pelagibaculum spongiae]PVZ70250.1 polysialic acid transporter [Pelagibaculum spongiae]